MCHCILAEKKKSKKVDESDGEPDDGTEEDGEEEEEEEEDNVDYAKIKKNDKKNPEAKKDGDVKSTKNSNSTKSDKDKDKDTDKANSVGDAPTSTDDKQKKENIVSLGEIAKINNYITNTKVESLQILHTVSKLSLSKFVVHR